MPLSNNAPRPRAWGETISIKLVPMKASVTDTFSTPKIRAVFCARRFSRIMSIGKRQATAKCRGIRVPASTARWRQTPPGRPWGMAVDHVECPPPLSVAVRLHRVARTIRPRPTDRSHRPLAQPKRRCAEGHTGTAETGSDVREEPEDGLSQEEITFYDSVARSERAMALMGNEDLWISAAELVKTVRESASIDWWLKDNVRTKMRVFALAVDREEVGRTRRCRAAPWSVIAHIGPDAALLDAFANPACAS